MTASELVPMASASFLEGPAALPDGRVYVSDIQANRLLQWSEAAGWRVVREDAGRPNGSVITHSGHLYTCEGGEMGPGGRRRIVRTDLEGEDYEVVADRFEGKRFNSPNDLTVAGDGTVYFTDPRYSPDRSDLEMDVEGVYRVTTDGHVERLLDARHVQRPNGIALSTDERTLYVVDSHPAPGGHRLILAFALEPDGSVRDSRVVHDFGTARGGDGIKVDEAGRLYVCAGVIRPRSEGEDDGCPPAVYVLDEDGTVLHRYAVPFDLITNCCFGGPDRRTLYVTAGSSLFSTRVDIPGHLPTGAVPASTN